ncbi:hypothetical protein ARMGADRAFT_928288 [Armillaria gallica]|uniref:Fido domain-containing protein n=1 Tax=Armillaria gallica TaxID=47427 RepID=A0A2H3DR35_ARMGA|nr:hypothetical protein ARMGADRAFT_928288 [Armillaria gallica]
MSESYSLPRTLFGNYKIQCCPFPEVDNELDYICKMAKQYIEYWRNLFTTASWIHLLPARCHPFNDRNGRTTRLSIASIPLMMHGYPPISVVLPSVPIIIAYDGDHLSLIECILRGMEMTIASVRCI